MLLKTGCRDLIAGPMITWSSRLRCTSCWPACARSCAAPPLKKSGMLVLGDLSINPATRVVRRGDQHIKLNAKEFSLLEYFMRHPNQVLTREMIESHIWSYDFICASNVVDVYVRRLRRKVDAPFAVKFLETIYGIGYRLRQPDSR